MLEEGRQAVGVALFDLAPPSAVAGAGLGATDEEAVEAEGGREATRFVGDLARPPIIVLVHQFV